MYVPVAGQLDVDRETRQGRRARSDVRPDHRPRRPGDAGLRVALSGRDRLPRLRRPRRRRAATISAPRWSPRPNGGAAERTTDDQRIDARSRAAARGATDGMPWCRAQPPSSSRRGRSSCGHVAAPSMPHRAVPARRVARALSGRPPSGHRGSWPTASRRRVHAGRAVRRRRGPLRGRHQRDHPLVRRKVTRDRHLSDRGMRPQVRRH